MNPGIKESRKFLINHFLDSWIPQGIFCQNLENMVILLKENRHILSFMYREQLAVFAC